MKFEFTPDTFDGEAVIVLDRPFEEVLTKRAGELDKLPVTFNGTILTPENVVLYYSWKGVRDLIFPIKIDRETFEWFTLLMSQTQLPIGNITPIGSYGQFIGIRVPLDESLKEGIGILLKTWVVEP